MPNQRRFHASAIPRGMIAGRLIARNVRKCLQAASKKRKNSADNAAAECRCAGRRRRMKPVLAGFRPAVNAAACAAFASRRPSAFAAMPRCHASRSASPLPCPPPTPLRRASCRQGCTHCGHAWRFSPGGARDESRAGSSSRVIWGKTKAIGVDCEARHGVARFACSLKTRRQPSLRMMRSIILPIFVGHAHTAAYEP